MTTPLNERREALHRAAQTLSRFARLPQADRDAIEHLPADVSLLRRGEDTPNSGVHLIVSGWACKMRPVANGQRQIFVFLLPGDFIGSFQIRPNFAFYRTVALTRLETIDLSPLLAKTAGGAPIMPAIVTAGRGLEDHAQGLLFDHMVRLGARDAYSGLADLLVELRERLARVDQVEADGSFILPVGQRVLAHVLGVSVVHVNQTLKRLAADGLIEIDGANVRLTDPQRMASLIGFSADTADEPRVQIAQGVDA
ncbi:MAG: Crp/Fnr family transcriptional regulator [Caulobacteraceae bacterium]